VSPALRYYSYVALNAEKRNVDLRASWRGGRPVGRNCNAGTGAASDLRARLLRFFYPNANCQNKGPGNPYTVPNFQRGAIQNDRTWSSGQTAGVAGERSRTHRSESSAPRMQQRQQTIPSQVARSGLARSRFSWPGKRLFQRCIDRCELGVELGAKPVHGSDDRELNPGGDQSILDRRRAGFVGDKFPENSFHCDLFLRFAKRNAGEARKLRARLAANVLKALDG
jgi:hypothetical protein